MHQVILVEPDRERPMALLKLMNTSTSIASAAIAAAMISAPTASATPTAGSICTDTLKIVSTTAGQMHLVSAPASSPLQPLTGRLHTHGSQDRRPLLPTRGFQ